MMKKKDPRAPDTTPERSYIMSCIRGRNNKSTELAMLCILKQFRITGWRRHLPLPGKPDFCFLKQKVIIFVDGCFWHGCPRCYKKPKQNIIFWSEKVLKNRARDKRTSRYLRQQGWTVLRFWEHSLKNTNLIGKRICNELTKKAR